MRKNIPAAPAAALLINVNKQAQIVAIFIKTQTEKAHNEKMMGGEERLSLAVPQEFK